LKHGQTKAKFWWRENPFVLAMCDVVFDDPPLMLVDVKVPEATAV
jgi:hypothetical protein